MTPKALIDQARAAMARAYAPYSHFHVGAALLGASGTVYLGCNVENAAYGVCSCAERTALFKAVSEGERKFAALAVVGGPEGVLRDECTPCGVCRQALSEFCGGDFPIHVCDGAGNIRTFTLGQLLPERFSSANL